MKVFLLQDRQVCRGREWQDWGVTRWRGGLGSVRGLWRDWTVHWLITKHFKTTQQGCWGAWLCDYRAFTSLKNLLLPVPMQSRKTQCEGPFESLRSMRGSRPAAAAWGVNRAPGQQVHQWETGVSPRPTGPSGGLPQHWVVYFSVGARPSCWRTARPKWGSQQETRAMLEHFSPRAGRDQMAALKIPDLRLVKELWPQRPCLQVAIPSKQRGHRSSNYGPVTRGKRSWQLH